MGECIKPNLNVKKEPGNKKNFRDIYSIRLYMKVVTIVGARPQFIKAAAVSRALKKEKRIQQVLLHTGQHFDENMSDIFFDELEIPKPDYNLNIHSLGHGSMTGRMMEAIETVLI